jgi:quercetin dioxygenase-like cupin family protein
MTDNNSCLDTVPEASSLDLYSELAGFTSHKPWQSGLYSKLLFKSDDLRLVLIAMETGARMKDHHADGTVSIHTLRGTLCIHLADRTHDLRTGQILTLAPGIKHDVEASEESEFLLTLSWPGGEKLQSLQHRGYGS